MTSPAALSRRAFLQRAGQLASAGVGLPLALNLAGLGDAAALTTDGYKALVCVFLAGGNDQHSLLIPYDEASYARYHLVRGGGPGVEAMGLALARADLDATVLSPRTALPGGKVLALPPQLQALHPLFASSQLALQLNVGPLLEPTTRRAYDRREVPVPPKLFSHNDQQSVWMSSLPEGATAGWGGRLGDLALDANGQSMFTCVSAAGNAVFLSGLNAGQYQISASERGALRVEAIERDLFYGSAVPNVLRTMMTTPRADPLENEYVRVCRRSLDAEGHINGALATVDRLFDPAVAGSQLGSQLELVARLIAARTSFGLKRQVFLVMRGGFDVHDTQASRQPRLMSELGDALGAFQSAMNRLGVADRVTAFTASDFGRTFTPNATGTDHGWGAHHLVMGGAVNGAHFYGYVPPLGTGNTDALEDQWHVGQGRLLPTTSLDQFVATLGRWFGASEGQLTDILPTLSRFGAAAGQPEYPIDIGFLRSS